MASQRGEGLRELRVLGARGISGRLRLLVIGRDAAFTAGQVLGLTTDRDIPPRLYSIASGEGESAWEILYTVEEGGILTPRLELLGPGDGVLVDGPSGNFMGGREPEVWVAGGTGVAPFLSMARSGLGAGSILIHGASEPELFHGEATFEALLGTRYLRSCPRAAEGDPRLFRGRVGALIESRPELPLDRPWLLCGGPGFVVDTRDLLIARGLPYPLVRAEVYF